MSGDNHGSTGGHDFVEDPARVIPPGSWQDKLLALVCLAVLFGFFLWAKDFQELPAAQSEKGSQTHAEPHQAQ
jgi:hypothetical protein